MAHQIFLSHATEDRDTAVQICAALEAEDIRCWMAPRDVKAGTDYAAAILDAIRTSDLVLLVFSSFADSSPYVLREIERAVNYKRPVLALRIDDSAPSASIEYYVNVWRKVDATTGVEKKQAEIITAVRDAIGIPASGGTKKGAGPWRWSRRRWGIALGSAVLVTALALGLGLGLTRDHPASEDAVMSGRVTWTELRPTGSLPSARYGQKMVQDPTSGRVIMFGGYAGADGGAALNDTWAYDPNANTWTDLQPSGTLPPGRFASSIVYDPASRGLIMFGGNDGTARLNDTWAYDLAANTWTKLSPSGSPPPGRGGQVMAYDPSGERILMFGGRASEMDFLNDIWAFDGAANTWTKLSPSGNLPPARGQSAMAYDPAARRMILFGGWNLETEFGDTWAYDPVARRWTELYPSGTPPTPRSGHDLVCDSSRAVLIMFGGAHDPGTGISFNDFNETWAYDAGANTWTKFAVAYGAAPPLRAGQSTVYDPSGNRLIMFGGSAAGPSAAGYPRDYNDAWACAL